MAVVLTSVASLVHHQHIGPNAHYSTDITLELPVGEADAPGRGVGARWLAVGARVGAVHFGPRAIKHAQVLGNTLLFLSIHLSGQPVLLVTPSLNFYIAGWKKRAVGLFSEVAGWMVTLTIAVADTFIDHNSTIAEHTLFFMP